MMGQKPLILPRQTALLLCGPLSPSARHEYVLLSGCTVHNWRTPFQSASNVTGGFMNLTSATWNILKINAIKKNHSNHARTVLIKLFFFFFFAKGLHSP